VQVVGYCRVSTADQAVEGVSLDAQRARIEAWCAAHGGALLACHQDAGISGKRSENRPGLLRALEEVCAAKAVLVVYSLSRLARSTRDTIDFSERLAAAGADLVSLSEKLDTTTASGKMLFRLLAVLAEFERDLISERTRSAVALKRRRGERLGQLPYGKRLAGGGRTLETDPAERLVIGIMLGLAGRGMSVRGIARELTTLGFPPKNGGRIWSPRTVRRILEREPRDEAPTIPE
jgi:DNA invertase Pin-like site-specific DNA recombinase